MPKTKKVPFEEQKSEWNAALAQLILDVEKSNKQDPKKEKYDFVTFLEAAQKCIK